jgi:arylsulfatase A-like enzyme
VIDNSPYRHSRVIAAGFAGQPADIYLDAAMSRIRILAVLLLGTVCSRGVAAEPFRPNVLLIVLDDQNAFAGRRDLAPEPVTPNLDRLAKRGVTFANAQCPAPVCNPSRTAFLSGLRPSTSGIYDNDQDDLPKGHILERTTSLPAYFRERGYKTAGGGKVFSSSYASAIGKRNWDETETGKGRRKGHGPMPPKEKIPLNGIGKHDWGAFPDRREDMEDWQLAGWASDFLARQQSQPFFLACGIVKPHTPWYVPQEYFDLFPHDRITIPDLAADELAGLPDVVKEKPHKTEAQLVARRKELVAAYLAASRYADDCVGRILDGLDKGPNRGNTLVVVCGDNGYQFGEKNNWSKGRLWEGSAHVPLVMAGPGIAQGKVSTRPVSLLDLYPTLLEFADLPPNPALEGVSIAALLRNPSARWERPALTTAGFKNHALRSERWRYIRYADGSEELYDHDRDPLERTNLASEPEAAAVKTKLKAWLPKRDEPRTPSTSSGRADD